MKRIVISQPMVFPWAGLFEQVRLADEFIHYDDVQLPQGRSFSTRVQIKTANGTAWLTVPVRREAKLIKDVEIDNSQRWPDRHLKTLQQNYARARYAGEMLDLVAEIYGKGHSHLSALNCEALETITRYFGFTARFSRSSDYAVDGSSSQKLLQLVQLRQGSIYITGHGASHYLDHALFESHGIRVEYMDYQKRPYPQLHGGFIPYVSILDVIANLGTGGREVIASSTLYWKEFLRHE